MQKNPVVITPKDIQRIMGYCYKTACRIQRRIRQFTGKRPGQIITIDDFCTYTGLTRENVRMLLQD
ncbi:coenzyme F420-0:L-glutamate ligase [Dawidia soli]|uniref:Uncharacterized protein n=1 Tax=Dawidia soli TaxID=2782352 RepID=A0AAP2DB75_9BACT|nr:coenzyme F420-0:L-glutamate ligase [Dawidia soli]MBT1688292.1 hypothetical protein [Dawidia soli]